jgi:nitrite reductase/ring-hydroxylating ferredoxin subunit
MSDEQERREICALADLPDPGALGFALDAGGIPDTAFVVRRGEIVRVYRNVCPHMGRPLNWAPDRFLTRAGDLIMCSAHGAIFDIDTGACVGGPCPGRALAAVPAAVEAGTVVVYLPPGETAETTQS